MFDCGACPSAWLFSDLGVISFGVFCGCGLMWFSLLVVCFGICVSWMAWVLLVGCFVVDFGYFRLLFVLGVVGLWCLFACGG